MWKDTRLRRRSRVSVYMGDVKLWIPPDRICTHPDVIQGAPVYEGKGTTTVTNPLMIREVLSKSTKNYDKTDTAATAVNEE